MNSFPSPSKKPFSDLTLSLALNPYPQPETLKSEVRSLCLIQLLLTCAAHVSSGNLHCADACLRHISSLSSVSGDSMQRLAARFSSSLAARLLKRWPGLHCALNQSHCTSGPDLDKMAWLTFSRAIPFLRFIYSIIHRTVLRAMSNEKVIHIVDLGSGDHNLWGPLIRVFSQLPSGPPHIKITCVHATKDVLDNLSVRLVKDAEALDIPFQFNPLNVHLRDVTVDMLKVQRGEAVAVCCLLSLHKLLAQEDLVAPCFGVERAHDAVKPCKQMEQLMLMVRSMSPKVFLVVEQEADHDSGRLVDRFIEGLYYYSALFDLVEAAAGLMSVYERLAVEEMFGKEIDNIVACDGVEREERHERAAKWTVRIGRAGFRQVWLWADAMDEARLLVESHGRVGYKVVNERGFLMICWHERPIYAISAWQ